MKEHAHATIHKPETGPAHDEGGKKAHGVYLNEGHLGANSLKADSKMPHTGPEHHAHMLATFRKRLWISLRAFGLAADRLHIHERTHRKFRSLGNRPDRDRGGLVVSISLHRAQNVEGVGECGRHQAFIIALYAEMYGFPVTIYLLVRFFGLNKTYLNANLWSTLLGYGYGETGMMISIILGCALLFAGFGIFMEGWRELHRAWQENRLVTGGPLRAGAVPQYTWLFIALFGEGIVHWPTIFSVALFPAIVLSYFCWREVRSAKSWNSSVMNIALTGNACRCSSRAGSMAQTCHDPKRHPRREYSGHPEKQESKASNNN